MSKKINQILTLLVTVGEFVLNEYFTLMMAALFAVLSFFLRNNFLIIISHALLVYSAVLLNESGVFNNFKDYVSNKIEDRFCKKERRLDWQIRNQK